MIKIFELFENENEHKIEVGDYVIVTEDPYGEEDWCEYVLESNHQGIDDDDLRHLRKRYGGGNVYYLGDFEDEEFEVGETVRYWGGNYISKNGEYCKILYVLGASTYSLLFNDGKIHDVCDSSRIQKLKKGFVRRKNYELDPYDEEDWGWVKEEILNEKYGYPLSIDPIKNHLVEFIYKKFDWWLNRKGPAFYSEDFTLDMDDFDPAIKNNSDFPLKTLRFTLLIKPEKNDNTVSGSASNYKKKRELDPYYWKNRIYRGKINGELEIIIHPGRRTIEIQEIKEKIKTVVTHELHHLYNGYKRFIKGISPDIHHRKNFLSNALIISLDKYEKCDYYYILIFIYYSFASEHELEALISEYYVSKETNTTYDKILELIDLDFEELYDIIKNEFKKYYSKVSLDTIPVEVYNNLIKGWKYVRLEYKDWAEKYNTDFKSFIKLMHDEIKRKGPYVIKKINKAIYGQ